MMKKYLLSILVSLATLLGLSSPTIAAPSGIVQSLFVQQGSGSVARLYSQKLGEVLSVKDFGAKGDSVTDDTAAFQATMNAAKALALVKPAYGITVYVPVGVYKITSTLTIPIYVNLLGETEEGSMIVAKFAGDTFTDEVVTGSASTLYFGRIEELTVLKSETDGTQNTTGKIINYHHNASLMAFRRLRLYGGEYAIYGENLGYSMWNTFENVFCDRQTIANVYIGQGSNATKIFSSQFHNAPVGVIFAGTSVGNVISASDFESYTSYAIQTDSAQITVIGGYNESKTTLTSAFKITAAGQIAAYGGYYKGAGAGYLASIDAASGSASVRDAMIVDYSYTWPALGQTQNMTLSGNTPGGSSTTWVRGYKDFTFSLAANGYNGVVHNLGLPASKIEWELYATPTAGYMSGKEIRVSGTAGNGALGYSVWQYDTNTIQTRTGASGGLVFDTSNGTYTSTGVTASHSLRLRVKVL